MKGLVAIDWGLIITNWTSEGEMHMYTHTYICQNNSPKSEYLSIYKPS